MFRISLYIDCSDLKSCPVQFISHKPWNGTKCIVHKSEFYSSKVYLCTDFINCRLKRRRDETPFSRGTIKYNSNCYTPNMAVICSCHSRELILLISSHRFSSSCMVKVKSCVFLTSCKPNIIILLFSLCLVVEHLLMFVVSSSKT